MKIDILIEILIEFINIEAESKSYSTKRRLESLKSQLEILRTIEEENKINFEKYSYMDFIETKKKEKVIAEKINQLQLQDFLLNQGRRKYDQRLHVNPRTMDGITDEIYAEYQELQNLPGYINPFDIKEDKDSKKEKEKWDSFEEELDEEQSVLKEMGELQRLENEKYQKTISPFMEDDPEIEIEQDEAIDDDSEEYEDITNKENKNK
jgi:hypothetical protein